MSVSACQPVLSGPLPLFIISPSLQLSQYLLSLFFSPVLRVVRVSKHADPEMPPTIQPYFRVAEGIGGGGFWMTAECRVFTHSVAGGSWLEDKLVEDGWVMCGFLVIED